VKSVAEVEPAPQECRIVRRLLLYIGLAFAALNLFTVLFVLCVHLGIADKITGGG
jgi:hypothetical protein